MAVVLKPAGSPYRRRFLARRPAVIPGLPRCPLPGVVSPVVRNTRPAATLRRAIYS